MRLGQPASRLRVCPFETCINISTILLLSCPIEVHMMSHYADVATGDHAHAGSWPSSYWNLKKFSQLLSRLLLGFFWLLSEENLSGPCMFHQHVPGIGC